ncbi:MAG: PEGA domain-containing protein [Spirochaetia bacterium]
MKSVMRVSGSLVVILAIVAGPAFGQGFSPKKIWDLTVTVNAPNAVVYVDNVLAPGGTTRVTGGAHNVKVHADGYFDFNGPVVVNGSMTFPVELTPQGFPLTIRVAVPAARIFVDGSEVTGTVPLVTSGAHSVQVSAPGFADYNATINVMAPMSLDVALQPALSLLVNVNVPGASIAVDSVPIQGNVAYVSRGPHGLSVHADGYLDWNGMVNVLNSMSFSVRLNPAGFPLTIRVGAPGASILVDGADVTGTVARVAPGPHTVSVSAPGFQDYNSVINVTAPLTMDVVLQSTGILLTVNANVNNALVTVNDTPKGPVPYSEYLPPGMYSVRVTAAGYTDYSANIPLNTAVNLNVQLSPAISMLAFVIPPIFRDPDMKPGDSRGQVRIFVDNRLVNPNRELERIPIAPGRHSIRIASGAFSMQLGDLVVQPGQSYVVELTMDMKVRTVPSPQ